MPDPLSTETTPILSLPLILPSQAQKHVPHNEALRLLDLLVQLTVASRSQTEPPASPPLGARYLVPAAGGGAFAGQAGRIALWEGTGWAFFPPLAGWRAEVLDEAVTLRFDGSQWQDGRAAPLQVARLGIGTEAEGANGLALEAEASLFSHAGAGHQLKINKAAEGETASLLFQTGWSGRAELGTTGSDRFALRVSADGAAFATALDLDPDSARVRIPVGLRLGTGAGAAAGTAALPALAFAGDPASGLWQPGAGQIGFSAGGVERLRLSAAGAALDVPLTGLALAQGPEDLTPGRLPVQGWMGLGQPLQAGTGAPFSGLLHAGFIAQDNPAAPAADAPGPGRHAGISLRAGASAGGQILISEAGAVYARARTAAGFGPWAVLRSSLNTTIDANGFVKEASPVLRLYEDRPDPEAPAWVSWRPLGEGRHEILGSGGLAREGWQIELPRDLNANPLCAVALEEGPEGQLLLSCAAPLWRKGRLQPGAAQKIPPGRFIALRLAPPPEGAAAAGETAEREGERG